MTKHQLHWRELIAVVGLCVLVLNSVAQPIHQDQRPKPLVILVSLDGFKPSYLSETSTPNLFKLALQGASSRGLISAFPSLTFPNHVTLVTGQLPDEHGIVNNTMTDPSTEQRFTLGSREAVENPFWWQEAQPIWITLRKQGKIASTLFWPGSEVAIQGLMPNDWLRYNHTMSHEERLKHVAAWLDRGDAQRPDFVTLYFSDVDSAGHAFGPSSEAVKLATEKVDQSVDKLLHILSDKGLLETTTLVIVSDHGMALTPENQVIQVNTLLSEFPQASWEWLGPTSGVRLNGESSDKVLQTLSKLPHVSCWPKASMPDKFKFGTHRRIPDIVCLADVGYSLSDNVDKKGPLGQHGYDPAHPDMHGILIVSGQQIRQTQLDLVNNLEVYGLLAKLLNAVPEPSAAKSLLPQKILK
jgi:ectonucleotide pyrophosphatase/phosphodiesterase family protein 5